MRAVGTVVLERTVLELQGEACLSFDEVESQRKATAVARSAVKPMVSFDVLFEAITAHAIRAGEKLRQHGPVAGTMTVFYHTSRSRPDRPQYTGSRTARLMPMKAPTWPALKRTRHRVSVRSAVCPIPTRSYNWEQRFAGGWSGALQSSVTIPRAPGDWRHGEDPPDSSGLVVSPRLC